MKNKILLSIVIILLCLPGAVYAQSELDINQLGSQVFDQVPTDKVNDFIRNVNKDLEEDIPLLTFDAIKEIIVGGVPWQKTIKMIMNSLFKELSSNFYLMGKLLFLAVMCTILQNLSNSFEKSSISILAYCVCYIFLTVLALHAFYNALTVARQAVGEMVGLMEALLPLIISLLAGVGAITSAALFSPLMIFSVSTISVIIQDLVLPMLFLTAVIECINYLGGRYKLSNLANFFKQFGMISLGLMLVLFIGIITIQGAAGSVADGLTLRTAKYATSTFIPIVGGMFADTVELVMGASLIIKNAVGIFGVIAIISICILPVVKLISLIMIMKITGALIQPMGDEKMAKSLDGMGNILLLVFAALLTAALMFFLAITIIVGVGSMTMMLR